VWQFRAKPAGSKVALEGWLDTLVLWRRSPEATIRPDTDGLIGGRYRGVLSRTGGYASQAQPFVPDEVAEVAGMATALDDFFPPLPPRRLHPGEVWQDSTQVRIQRLADSALSGVPLQRYALELTGEARSALVAHDSVPLRLHQVTRERGTFVWHPTLGLVRRQRNLVVETEVPASRTVRQAVRSRIEQQITVTRDLTVPLDRCARAARLRPRPDQPPAGDTGIRAPAAPAPAAPDR
jgi:hypothetical protein